MEDRLINFEDVETNYELSLDDKIRKKLITQKNLIVC